MQNAFENIISFFPIADGICYIYYKSGIFIALSVFRHEYIFWHPDLSRNRLIVCFFEMHEFQTTRKQLRLVDSSLREMSTKTDKVPQKSQDFYLEFAFLVLIKL